MEASELAFDRIEIESEEGTRSVTPAQFAELDVSERVRIVLCRSIRFYTGAEPVDTLRALADLRQLRIEG